MNRKLWPTSALTFALLAMLVNRIELVRGQSPNTVRIGSKSFTESVILGEMLVVLASQTGANVEHRSELGGTQFLWQALVKGDIDAYVEYSGTLTEEILAGEQIRQLDLIRDRIHRDGIGMTEPLGFNNTYALGMRDNRASELGIAKISQLRDHPTLRLGFSDEFMERSDGWQGLKSQYQLPQETVRALDHSLAYRGVWTGSIDVVDLYSTDPEIVSFQLRVLEDDRAYFPLYEAVILYRSKLEQSHPAVVEAFRTLEGKIDSSTMAGLNKQSRIDRQPEQAIAARFLHDHVDSKIAIPDPNANQFRRSLKRFLTNSMEHLFLVGISLSLAIATSIPLGIVAYKKPNWGGWILAIVGIIQTIPSMALLVFMIPLLGLGAKPAILALFLYSLLPIVRGTHTGLAGLPQSIHESALALGLPDLARLRLIELPLASRSILSGIKTSAVINVGTATIGALIGAGGYGQPIITGIRLADFWLILQGALPAAILALLVQAGFSWAERALVPAGLRLSELKQN
jgi:osmoprotectant transport system permease protein